LGFSKETQAVCQRVGIFCPARWLSAIFLSEKKVRNKLKLWLILRPILLSSRHGSCYIKVAWETGETGSDREPTLPEG
jgi:hypothetical protein